MIIEDQTRTQTDYAEDTSKSSGVMSFVGGVALTLIVLFIWGVAAGSGSGTITEFALPLFISSVVMPTLWILGRGSKKFKLAFFVDASFFIVLFTVLIYQNTTKDNPAGSFSESIVLFAKVLGGVLFIVGSFIFPRLWRRRVPPQV